MVQWSSLAVMGLWVKSPPGRTPSGRAAAVKSRQALYHSWEVTSWGELRAGCCLWGALLALFCNPVTLLIEGESPSCVC